MHRSEQKCAQFYTEWCIMEYGEGALWDGMRQPPSYAEFTHKKRYWEHILSSKYTDIYVVAIL